jgi:hypothetical protein
MGLLASRPNTNLEDQVSEFISPGDRVAQLYPGHWVARDHHFPHPLKWAPEEVFTLMFLTRRCVGSVVECVK